MSNKKETIEEAGEVILRRRGEAELAIRTIIDDLAKETRLNISSVDISFIDMATFADLVVRKNRYSVERVTITITE